MGWHWISWMAIRICHCCHLFETSYNVGNIWHLFVGVPMPASTCHPWSSSSRKPYAYLEIYLVYNANFCGPLCRILQKTKFLQFFACLLQISEECCQIWSVTLSRILFQNYEISLEFQSGSVPIFPCPVFSFGILLSPFSMTNFHSRDSAQLFCIMEFYKVCNSELVVLKVSSSSKLTTFRWRRATRR